MNDKYMKQIVEREENEKLLRSITTEMGKYLALLQKYIITNNLGSAGIALANVDVQYAMLKHLDEKVNGKKTDVKVA